jgi:signal transduction protein with GAF and PtsI domain
MQFSSNDSHIGPLLEVTLTQANAQGVYLYRFDRGEVAARLVASVGQSATAGNLGLPLHSKAAREHAERTAPIMLHEAAWSDWRFAGLPEFQKNRFQGVASIPLRSGISAVGMVNICRSREAPWKPSELSFLLSLSLPLAALLVTEEANRSLQKEVERLAQELADRKLLERAKGLLQARFEWSEEEAYLYLRRSSRQRRTPMRELAREIIQAGGSDLAEIADHAG